MLELNQKEPSSKKVREQNEKEAIYDHAYSLDLLNNDLVLQQNILTDKITRIIDKHRIHGIAFYRNPRFYSLFCFIIIVKYFSSYPYVL